MLKYLQTFILFLLLSQSVKAQDITSKKIDSLLNAYVAVHQFNGSALVIQQGKKVYEKALAIKMLP